MPIHARAFALLTKHQRQWSAKPLSAANIQAFQANLTKLASPRNRSCPMIVISSKLGHPEKVGLEKSRLAFLDEMQRCAQLGLTLLNFHPGSHLN
ncbi:hypothetical protein Tel_10030 [Candidatus Tenderia electrophaga]|jgi:deoxyribonuclease-4|uniref:Xylose isomerase-like TIM barrel domain-containing protein n=1 Tax=Candidatus Tenderia electrophaga TaxID=1748243 RepID=A0A0S2TEA1_9GAMM|nr:hypothetical protein Tel_10030 [Candidatus Tenderia electrophaga]